MTTEAEERVARAIRRVLGEYDVPVSEALASIVAGAVFDEINAIAEEQFGHKVFVEAEKREARN